MADSSREQSTPEISKVADQRPMLAT